MKIDEKTYVALPPNLKALFWKLPNPGSEEVLAGFPVTGDNSRQRRGQYGGGIFAGGLKRDSTEHTDSGSASRFFYCAKASRAERDAGLEGMPTKHVGTYAQDAWSREHMGNTPDNERQPVHNPHPTVKPTDLMRYLCRLVTPPGGTVLDPFMGSGSTGKAAILEGFNFIGIELEKDYVEIAERRIDSVSPLLQAVAI